MNTIRVKKRSRTFKTALEVNEGINGESIELMLERLREGEGEEGIADRDLVYNDNEVTAVNPITNIRSDKMELMLEEKIGEYEHKHKKQSAKKVEDEPKKEKGDEATTGGEGEE